MANNKINFEVIGLFVEKYLGKDYISEPEEIYIGTRCIGVNYRFEEVPQEMERYHLFCRTEDDRKYVLSLETEYDCGPDGQEASYGWARIEEVEKFGPFTHRPKGDVRFCLEVIEDEDDEEFFLLADISNDVFEVFSDGFDDYCPSGYVCINMDKFVPLKRAMNHRPVWILKGKSGLGKSTLAFSLEGMSVFETDSVDQLPDAIDTSVVVLGNRSGFTVDDVIAKLVGNPKVIQVSFED